MRDRVNGFLCGLAGGVAGLAAMGLARRITRPVVRKRKDPRLVFSSERSMSLVGGLHAERGEPASQALARITYRAIIRRPPSQVDVRRLGRAIHWAGGLLVAGVYGALRTTSRPPADVAAGALLGVGLWAASDELILPLLGLADKPTAAHPTEHLQDLAARLGYGVATASATQALRTLVRAR